MYILHCKNCGDSYGVKGTKETTCTCGITSGILEEDKLVFSGDPLIIEIDDASLSDALFQQQVSSVPQPLKAKLVLTNDENIIRR